MSSAISQFSRTGVTSPMGTLIGELKTKVDTDTEAAFRQLCAKADTDVAGALRNWVYLRVHGKTYDQVVFEAMERRSALLFGDVKTVHALQGRDDTTGATGPIEGLGDVPPLTGGGQE